MVEERSAIDLLLDENYTGNIVMYDENDKEVEFEQIAIIPFNDKIYALLHPLNVDTLDEDEAIVFSVEEIDDEDAIVLVEDMNVVNAVFDEYYRLLKEQEDN